jgi:hypothetical protein
MDGLSRYFAAENQMRLVRWSTARDALQKAAVLCALPRIHRSIPCSKHAKVLPFVSFLLVYSTSF